LNYAGAESLKSIARLWEKEKAKFGGENAACANIQLKMSKNV